MGKQEPKILPFRKRTLAQSQPNTAIIEINASSREHPVALSESELRSVVARIVLHGTYRETRHAADDRSYRNISDDDIQFMLRGPWKLSAKPEWDERHGNWKYKLAGNDIEGDDLVLVVAVNTDEQSITVITKY